MAFPVVDGATVLAPVVNGAAGLALVVRETRPVEAGGACEVVRGLGTWAVVTGLAAAVVSGLF